MKPKIKKKKLPNFSRIYLVRHGEAQNPKKIIYGYLPLPLSAKGRAQARCAGKILKDKNIFLIFSSPQKRTRETARIISQVISRGKIKVGVIKNLREVALGHFLEKLTKRQARDKYPEIVRDYYRFPARVKAGGENLAETADRVLRAIHGMSKIHPGRNLVFVSHQDSILAALLKISKRSFNDLHKVKAICGTGAVCEIWSVGKRLINKTYLAP